MKTDDDRLMDIYIWLSNTFDCDTAFSGESLNEYISIHLPNWCEENCDDMNTPKCWEKYFELKFAGKDGKV